MADVESLVGWETFTPDEKQFLMVYPWFGEKKMAAEYIGRDAQWYDRRQRQCPLFKDAVSTRASTPTRIVRQYAADLMGKAMLRLEEMLEPNGADKRTQLEATKLLLRMTGAAETEEPQVPARPHTVNVWDVKMFGTQGKIQEEERLRQPVDDGHVVEGELVVKDDEAEVEHQDNGRW